MNIEKQYQDDHSVKLIVELDQEKMNTYKRRAATKISSRGKIPGFRPGKAPYDIVVRMFGEGAVSEQAIEMFVDAEYNNILKEADVDPGAMGSLEAVDNPELPKITFRVPLAPEVDLGDYHAVRLPYAWETPGEKEVENALEDLRQRYATSETVDRAIDTGDYVLLDVSSETVELNRTGFATVIYKDERSTEWPYSGFSQELKGMKAGDSKAIQHKFPADWEVETLRDVDAEMTATIKIVRGTILPDLDDAFAKQVGGGETLDELKAVIKQDVEKRSQDVYDDKYFEELIEKIKSGATIKFHEHTLEHEGEHVLNDFSSRIAQQGMDMEAYFKMRNTTREQFIENEVKPVAKKRLERSLLIDEIIRKEKLQVSNEELSQEFNNTLTELAMQGMDFSKMGGGKQKQREFSQMLAMESAGRVMTRKALDMLKAIATGEYKPVEEQTAAEIAGEAQAETAAEAQTETGTDKVGQENAEA